MPYRKKGQNRAHRGGGYGYIQRGGGYIAQASKLASLAAQVYALKKMINVEYKSLRSTVLGAVQAGNVLNLFALAVGDDFDDRDGRKIRPFSVQVKGQVVMHASAVATSYRIVIVKDRAGTTTQPAITDLFVSAIRFARGEPKIDSPDVSSRFQIIWDKTYKMEDSGVKLHEINFYKQLNGHMYFTGATASDEGRGSIYMFTATTEATNVPVVEAVAITKWIDN